jgi:hypothetical protein
MSKPDPQTTDNTHNTDNTLDRSLRDRISQILVKNNLRADQTAICELHNLLKEAFKAGQSFANDLRNC